MIQVPIEYVITGLKDSDGPLYKPKSAMFPGENKLVIDNMLFLLNDSPYLSEDGTFMLPLRAMIEVFKQAGDGNYQISWLNKEKVIKWSMGSRVIEISVADNTITINGPGPFPLMKNIEIQNDKAYISQQDFCF